MTIRFDVDIKDENLKKLVGDKLPLMMSRTMQLVAEEVWTNISKEAPKDTGRLAGSYQLTRLGALTWGVHSNVEYRWWVHEGAGLYGPHERRIYPQRAQALAFYWDKVGEFVFFRSVAGQKPNRFIDRAIDSARERIDAFARRAAREVMS